MINWESFQNQNYDMIIVFLQVNEMKKVRWIY